MRDKEEKREAKEMRRECMGPMMPHQQLKELITAVS